MTSTQHIDNTVTQHNIDAEADFVISQNSRLSLSAGYLNNKNTSHDNLNKGLGNPNDIDGDNKYNSLTMKGDYTVGFHNGYSLGMGVSYSTVNNQGYSTYQDMQSGESYYEDHSNLRDNTGAAYVNLSKSYGKVFASVGVRGELLDSKYKKNGAIWYDDNSLSLYPRITLQTPISKDVTVIGAFISQSTRPSFKELSPLFKYINNYLFEQGNPSLRKTDIYTASLSMILKNKFVAQARFIRNVNATMWSFVEKKIGEDVLVNQPSNINYGMWLFNLSYSDAWGIYRFSYNASLKYIPKDLPYLDGTSPVKPQVMASAVNQFVLSPKTLLSVNVNYTSRFANLGLEQKAACGLDCWVRQTFGKDDRLQIILQGSDLLHRSTPKSYVKINNVRSTSVPDFDTRSVSLTIRYMLNGFQNIFKRRNANADVETRIRQ